MHAEPLEVRPSEAECIAFAYTLAAEGDAWAALVRVVEDALTDLAEAECRILQRDRLVSAGYARAGLRRA